jgi:tRNA-Thr(GGU) m(6)t(6)A37 methyltransferase TsaA
MPYEHSTKAIGIIRSPFETKEEAPIQGAFAPEREGRLEILEEYREGLNDLEGFTHLHLLYLFDRAGEVKMVRPTFLSDTPHGLFSTRHPCRPSGIGLTIVKLLSVDVGKGVVEVAGIDVLDGTPLLDIKPYIVKFDCFPDAAEGWFKEVQNRPKPKGRE